MSIQLSMILYIFRALFYETDTIIKSPKSVIINYFYKL